MIASGMGENPYGPFHFQALFLRARRFDGKVQPRSQAVTSRPATLLQPGYAHFCVGDTERLSAPSTPGLILMGGGGDVAEAFRWLLSKAPAGHVVVLRASGGGHYNSYLYEMGRSSSVRTFVIHDVQATHDAFLIQSVREASALFIAGGNQWDYVRMWRGTPLERAIQSLADRGVPIGGQSAGLHILGQYSFTAQFDTIDSAAALRAPQSRVVAVEGDFLRLPHLDATITDSHFSNRDRMGRLLCFLSRMLEQGAERACGIGVDEQTAVAVEGDGSATVLGFGSAYFVQAPGQVVGSGPLSLRNVRVIKVRAGGTFHLPSWTHCGCEEYALQATAGQIHSSKGCLY